MWYWQIYINVYKITHIKYMILKVFNLFLFNIVAKIKLHEE
jgi:hypothetical protein